jgi:hypothetical protein
LEALSKFAVALSATPTEFYKAKTAALEALRGVDLKYQEITFLPQAAKTMSGDDLMLRLTSMRSASVVFP